MEQSTQPATTKKRRGRFGAIALALVAAVLVVVVLVLALGGGEDAKPGTPRELSADELESLAEDNGEPIYWAGEMEGTKLEVTETTQGHVFVRYLPQLAPIGDNKPQYTTVATYPKADALRAVSRAGKNPGMVARRVAGGGVATWSRSRPSSVYVAFPGVDFLIEVYHPRASTARDLALSGRIRPAG